MLRIITWTSYIPYKRIKSNVVPKRFEFYKRELVAAQGFILLWAKSCHLVHTPEDLGCRFSSLFTCYGTGDRWLNLLLSMRSITCLAQMMWWTFCGCMSIMASIFLGRGLCGWDNLITGHGHQEVCSLWEDLFITNGPPNSFWVFFFIFLSIILGNRITRTRSLSRMTKAECVFVKWVGQLLSIQLQFY